VPRVGLLAAQGHLPPPPAGRIYEVWLRQGSTAPAPTSALFSVTANGAATVDVPGDLRGISQVLVTQEPAGASRVSTHRPVIVLAHVSAGDPGVIRGRPRREVVIGTNSSGGTRWD
jgi:hypothetical protein